MPRPRSRLPWQFDDATQTFTTPSGVVSLQELAALRYGLATSHIDLSGPWTGWRVRGATLRGPRGSSMIVRPETAAQFARWQRDMEARDAAAFGLEQSNQRPRLYLVR